MSSMAVDNRNHALIGGVLVGLGYFLQGRKRFKAEHRFPPIVSHRNFAYRLRTDVTPENWGSDDKIAWYCPIYATYDSPNDLGRCVQFILSEIHMTPEDWKQQGWYEDEIEDKLITPHQDESNIFIYGGSESFASDMEVGKTIYQQLGGNRFRMMTGAKEMVWDGDTNSLQMKLGRNSLGANYLVITLNNRDLYDMRFESRRWNRKTYDLNVKVKAEYNDLYADQLQSVFTEATGLYTRMAESFSQWSQDELNEPSHKGSKMQFDDWLDDEIKSHGDIPLSEWGYEEEHDEPEHQHAENFNAETVSKPIYLLYDTDNWGQESWCYMGTEDFLKSEQFESYYYTFIDPKESDESPDVYDNMSIEEVVDKMNAYGGAENPEQRAKLLKLEFGEYGYSWPYPAHWTKELVEDIIEGKKWDGSGATMDAMLGKANYVHAINNPDDEEAESFNAEMVDVENNLIEIPCVIDGQDAILTNFGYGVHGDEIGRLHFYFPDGDFVFQDDDLESQGDTWEEKMKRLDKDMDRIFKENDIPPHKGVGVDESRIDLRRVIDELGVDTIEWDEEKGDLMLTLELNDGVDKQYAYISTPLKRDDFVNHNNAETFNAESGEPIYVVRRDYTGVETDYLIGTESYIREEMDLAISIGSRELGIDYQNVSLEEIFDTVFDAYESDEYGSELVGKFTDGMYLALRRNRNGGVMVMMDGGEYRKPQTLDYTFDLSRLGFKNEANAETFNAESGEPIYVVRRDYTGGEIWYVIGTEEYIRRELAEPIDITADEGDIDYEGMSLEEIFDTVFEYSDEYGPDLVGKFTDGMYLRLKSYDGDKDVGVLEMFDGETLDYTFDLSRLGFKHESNAETFDAENRPPSYMADADAHKLMEGAWRINSFVESEEEYPEWWKSRLSVVASTVDDLADYLDYSESEDFETETFNAEAEGGMLYSKGEMPAGIGHYVWSVDSDEGGYYQVRRVGSEMTTAIPMKYFERIWEGTGPNNFNNPSHNSFAEPKEGKYSPHLLDFRYPKYMRKSTDPLKKGSKHQIVLDANEWDWERFGNENPKLLRKLQRKDGQFFYVFANFDPSHWMHHSKRKVKLKRRA